MDPFEPERIIRLISTFFTKTDRLVLIVDKVSDFNIDSIESNINIIKVTDSIESIGDYIEANY